MNEIQEMKDRRDQLTSELESLRAALTPYEAALENPETIEQGREREVRDQYNDRKRQIDSLDMELYRLTPKIQRREYLANYDVLTSGNSLCPWASRSSWRNNATRACH